jgi:hypothetical protein
LEAPYRTFPAFDEGEFWRRVVESPHVIVHDGILHPLTMDRNS